MAFLQNYQTTSVLQIFCLSLGIHVSSMSTHSHYKGIIFFFFIKTFSLILLKFPTFERKSQNVSSTFRIWSVKIFNEIILFFLFCFYHHTTFSWLLSLNNYKSNHLQWKYFQLRVLQIYFTFLYKTYFICFLILWFKCDTEQINQRSYIALVILIRGFCWKKQ